MKVTRKNLAIFIFGILLAGILYAFLMYGLADFDGLRIDETADDDRESEYGFVDISDNSTRKDINKRVGEIIWQSKAIDIIVLGLLLMVASEAAATVVRGLEAQQGEFRQLVDTEKFLTLKAEKDSMKKRKEG